MIIFQKILPENIDSLPSEAVKFLDDAIKRTPASTSRLDVTLDIAKKGYGNIYTISNNGFLVGCCYLLVYDTPRGKVVSPVLLGGEYMYVWQDDFYEFLYDFCQKVEAVKVRWIGRKGWSKAWPKARVIGYTFEHDIEPA